MNIKKQLAHFYDQNAQQFSKTRKKKRPELEIIAKYIAQHPKQEIYMLELGCGDGRLIDYLQEYAGSKKITYTGVDISRQLINIAKTNYKEQTFINSDMSTYLISCQQEQYDIILSIAAFHHLPSPRERYFVMKNIYRALKYKGQVIMTNRARSKRFIQKYRRQIAKARGQKILTLGYRAWNDIMIPWKTKGKVFNRYYHIFTRKELHHIIQKSGFTVDKSTHIDKYGQENIQWNRARNILTIAQKQAIIDKS